MNEQQRVRGLDEVLASGLLHAGGQRFEVGGEWAQGRSLFGGLTATLALRAMRSVLPGDGEPRRLRGLLVTFVGPVEPGEVEVAVEPLRSGRSATLIAARVVQGGETKALVEGAFAADRESGIEVPSVAAPSTAAPGDLPELPYVPGLVPEFTRRLEYRLAFGAMPFSGATQAEVGGWTRLRESGVPATEEHLVALADAWPAPVLPMFSRPAPASSLTWSLELLEPVTGPADAWYLQRLTADRACGGWVHVDMKMWSSDGRLVAIGRQVVAIFDR